MKILIHRLYTFLFLNLICAMVVAQIANTTLGDLAGNSISTGDYNTFIGAGAGQNNNGNLNTMLGYAAGTNNLLGSSNVFLGPWAGFNSSGSGNILIGHYAGSSFIGSNQLFIDNSSTSSPLIWGDFSSDLLNFNGDVGIGTTSPGYPLHVMRNVTSQWQARFENGSSNVYLAHSNGYGIHINTGGTNNTTKYALKIKNADQTHLYLREDGNLGLGTESPEGQLEIVGSGTIGGKLDPGLSFLKVGDGTNYLIMDNNEFYSSTDINFGTSYSHSFQFRNVDANGVEDLMEIQSNGRVGIGTTSPGNSLDVVGGIDINDFVRHNGDTNTSFGFLGNDTIRFRTNGTDRMRILPDGHIDIASKFRFSSGANRSGLMKLAQSGTDNWSGLSIEHTSTTAWSLMGDDTHFGLFDDENNDWILQHGSDDTALRLYFNGNERLATTSGGVSINGDISASNLNISNWDDAYPERGSQIAGYGLTWDGNELDLDFSSTHLNILKDDRLLVFDDGQKMITSNDGRGNFNIQLGQDVSGNHIGDGSNDDGSAKIQLYGDNNPGLLALNAGPVMNDGLQNIFNIGLSINAADQLLRIGNPGDANGMVGTDGHVIANVSGNLLTDSLLARDANGLLVGDDSGNGLFIEDGGQIGVGTSTPESDLEILSSETLGGLFTPANAALKIGDGTIELLLDGNEIYANKTLYFGSSPTHDFVFQNVDDQGSSELMRLEETGDLVVTGNITGANLNTTNWNTAYDERGSQIAGSGLVWNSGVLDVSGTIRPDFLVLPNKEQSNPPNESGALYFDENYFSGYSAFTGSNGGGLAIQNEDGWGALFSTTNMHWITPTFHGLTINRFNDGDPYVRLDRDSLYSWKAQVDNEGKFEIRDDSAATEPFKIEHGAATASLYIDAAGQVGIGTNNPLATLHVNGPVRGAETGGALKIQTNHGYLNLGPAYNADYAHIETDRPAFYFNKRLSLAEGIVSTGQSQLQLQTNNGAALLLSDTAATVPSTHTLTVQGGLKFEGGISQDNNPDDMLVLKGDGTMAKRSVQSIESPWLFAEILVGQDTMLAICPDPDVVGVDSVMIDSVLVGQVLVDVVDLNGNLRIGESAYIDDDLNYGDNGDNNDIADDWIKFSGYLDFKSDSLDHGIHILDRDSYTDYLNIYHNNNDSYLSNSSGADNYFMKTNNGLDVEFARKVTIPDLDVDKMISSDSIIFVIDEDNTDTASAFVFRKHHDATHQELFKIQEDGAVMISEMTQDDTLASILVRNPLTGQLHTRDASTVGPWNATAGSNLIFDGSIGINKLSGEPAAELEVVGNALLSGNLIADSLKVNELINEKSALIKENLVVNGYALTDSIRVTSGVSINGDLSAQTAILTGIAGDSAVLNNRVVAGAFYTSGSGDFGTVNATGLGHFGTIQSGDATVGALTATSYNSGGTATFHDISTTTFTATGLGDFGTLNSGSATLTDLTATEVSADTLAITNGISTNLLSAGTSDLGAVTASSYNAGGTASFNDINAAAISADTLSLSNGINAGTLTAGTSSLGATTVASLTTSGSGSFGTLQATSFNTTGLGDFGGLKASLTADDTLSRIVAVDQNGHFSYRNLSSINQSPWSDLSTALAYTNAISIGKTTAPSTQLDVEGNADVNGTLTTNTLEAPAINVAGMGTNTTPANLIAEDASGNLALFDFNLLPTPKWTEGTGFVYRGDKVGIGMTTEPTATLEVAGTVKATGLSDGSSYDSLVTIDASGNLGKKAISSLNLSEWNYSGAALYHAGRIGMGTTSNYNTNIQVGITTALATGMEVKSTHAAAGGYGVRSWVNRDDTKAFAVVNDGNGEDVFRVLGNGYVEARKVTVQANGWSDFVFEKDYELKPLAEVEAYVKENKHLPDVPSEVDVKEKGIDLGNMDAVLLQKVEELTLYTIEQEKKLEAQSELLETQMALLRQQGEMIAELQKQLNR